MGASYSGGGLTTGISTILTRGAPEDTGEFQELCDKICPPSAHIPVMELFSTLQLDHVRDILSNQPRTLARLIVYCIDVLESTVKCPVESSYPRAMNAVRLLTRILPAILESGESCEFTKRLFWDEGGFIPPPVGETK